MNTLKNKVIPVNADVWTIKSIQTEFNVSEEDAVKLYTFSLSDPHVRYSILCDVFSLFESGFINCVVEGIKKDD